MARRTVVSILTLLGILLAAARAPDVARAQGFSPISLATSQSDLSQGDTSRAARADALGRIPLDRLTPEAQNRIGQVVESPTLFRRLPSQQFECDPELFVFLVRHPEVMVGIWEVMGITNVQTQRTAPFQLQANDHAGTECDIDLVYGDRETHLFYATGDYSGPLVAMPITGKGVFLLRSDYITRPDGRTAVVGSLDCFIQLDSLGADLVARTLSRLIGRTADSNFTETARFMSQISRSAEQNTQGMEDLAGRLPQVLPEVRQRFAEQCRAVHEGSSSRTAALSAESP